MELELTVVTGAERRDVVAQLDDGATVAQLRAALHAGPGPGLWIGERFAPAEVGVASAGIRSGDVLGTDRAVALPRPAGVAPVVLAAVGGLDAGGSVSIGPTGASVGRSPDNDLRLRDSEVSRSHVHVGLAADGTVHVQDTGSRNGVGHRATRLVDATGATDVPLGDCIRVGESMLVTRQVRGIAADLTDDPTTGVRAFNRMPAIEAPRVMPTLFEPAPPEKPGGFRMPWIASLAPLLIGGLIYLLFPQFGGYLLITMALSPILLIASAVSDRRGGKKSYRTRLREYAADRAGYDGALEAVAHDDERSSRADAPDPAELVRRAVHHDAALWLRRRSGEHFLDLRIGLVDRPARVTLQSDAGSVTPPIVHDVPLSVRLTDAGVLGVAAPRPSLLAVSRALVLQLATLHSPGELGLVVLTGDDTADDWHWPLWLPHLRPHTGEAGQFACRRLVAVDGEQAATRVAELQRLVDERAGEQRALLACGPPQGRAFVVIIDGARRMRAVPGLAKLLATGPSAGIHAVCLDADETALPDECGATVVGAREGGTRGRVRVGGQNPVEEVLLDGVAADKADAAARALTPLIALGDGPGGRELPDTVRFTELTATEADPALVGRRWSSPAGSSRARSSKAVIGSGPGGAPVEIDLVRDGPHALIAGTSGAGKSELLQTLVASLALNNHPDSLNFVLVDYKGGSAFAACAELPHCAGLITDLDGHLVGRALDSLSAELKRRETLLGEVGAKDIADYWARSDAPLPRLVIVVDEFASLVEEVPDFVPGVVGIGMRGRSLGVHVVLATQRPAGVVTADMRANLNLRISLRVTSEAESTDVIDSGLAARILPRQPGRAYLRTGHSELTAFQGARVGWPIAEPCDVMAQPAVSVAPMSIRTAGGVPLVTVTSDVDEHGRTDLSDLVVSMRESAVELGVAPPRRPWLPALPDFVPAESVPPVAHAATRAVLGLIDRPAAQAQDAFVIDLDETGPVVIAGSARSGRSTALRTLAGSLATAASPEDLHLYALDCGNHALAALDGLPHTGAVVDGADQIRTARLLTLLSDEITRRQRIFLAGGFGSLAEQRQAAGGDELPYAVLLLDRLESFVGRYEDVDNGALVDRLEHVLRAGPALGICCVLATDRTGFTHRIGSAVAARLVLAQATPDDLLYFGVDRRDVPGHMPPGRAIWTPTGAEVQVAFAGADPGGGSQLTRLRELAATLTHRWDSMPPASRPRRLDVLPETINAAQVDALRDSPRASGALTVGVGGDHLAPIDLDLGALGGCFVVCGAGRTGRSTTLRSLVESIVTDLPVLVVAPRPSVLRNLNRPGVTVLSTDLVSQLSTHLGSGRPCLLVVDDAERLDDPVLAPLLEDFVRSARDTGSLVLAAATTEDVLMNRYRGWLATARRDRTGLLLNPASHVDGEVFDVRLPRSLAGGWPAGRALLVVAGETSTVQVTDCTREAVRPS